jgi:acyl-CoA reductase-like NAD-dependent aldehyde dehydrogenase
MSQILEPVIKAPTAVLRDEYRCLIGGELVASSSGKTFAKFNPATGEKLADVPDCGADDVDRAIQAAHNAFLEWRKLTPSERGAYCRRFAARLRERSEVYAMLDALDGGNPLRSMRQDVAAVAAQFDYYAGIAPEIKGETFPSMSGTLNFTRREPYGVVARIPAFNHPIMFSGRIGAALVAGNTVVVKPTKQTPISALEMAHDAKDIFPPGVVSVITGFGGGGGIGMLLVKHPLVRRITLTGSVAVGEEIMRAAASGMKIVTLELGGKNPMIVFPDVDLEKAVESAFCGMNYTWTAGQSCGSTSRLFLHEDIHDEFLERLVEKIKKIRVGLPSDEKTEMGCMVSQKQFDWVMSCIETGKKEGARLVTGGGRATQPELRNGFFVLPTVFDQVDYRMRIAQDEIFGPVQSVLTWKDPKELIHMANSVIYGLTASVWTRDFPTAYRVASEIEAGYIWINDSSRHFPGVPYGGYKQSGFGRDECLDNLLSYTQIKSINVKLS